MNLVSCNCGVVIDREKLYFPRVWGDDGAALDTSVWNHFLQDYVATTPCPVCGEQILEKDE